jgi:hypothetical protein
MQCPNSLESFTLDKAFGLGTSMNVGQLSDGPLFMKCIVPKALILLQKGLMMNFPL